MKVSNRNTLEKKVLNMFEINNEDTKTTQCFVC